MSTANIILLLSSLTLITHAFLLILLITFIIKKITTSDSFIHQHITKLFQFLSRHSIFICLIFAIIATSGSLYFSEIAHLTPCKLCWFQRIFTYPLVILLITAIIRQDKKIWTYIIPLTIINSCFAIYQYYLQIFSIQTNFCSIDSTESCATKQIFTFHYITIPLMSATASIIILILMIMLKNHHQKNR